MEESGGMLTHNGEERLGARQQLRYATRRLLRRAKFALGNDPVFLPILLRLTPLGTSRKITDHTDLVVEGFPRGGNTFTVFALRDASKHELDIVSHVHHPSQVKHATARNVPTVLVVREPVPVLASYLVFGKHGRPATVIREYCAYHRVLLPYVDRVAVCDFKEITTDLSSVIARINGRFGLSIPPFDQSPTNVDAVFAEISREHRLVHRHADPTDVVPRPATGRSDMTERMRASLQDPAHKALLDEATELYEFFRAKAIEQRDAFEGQTSTQGEPSGT